MKFFFLSQRNFKTDVGESVRIYGFLNSLAEEGNEVIFISNATDYKTFHPSIQHYYIGKSVITKRFFQALLSLFPVWFVSACYQPFFKRLAVIFDKLGVHSAPVFFFDYLDNSIGYVLKKNRLIDSYVNDVHGIATIEFDFHAKHARVWWKRMLYKVKYIMADKLDRKVFESAKGFIFGSDNMHKYFVTRYGIQGKASVIIPYLLSNDAAQRVTDDDLRKKLLSDLCIREDEFVVMFVGTYKPTAGVDDLITAFDKLNYEKNDCRLILIGEGPSKAECIRLANAKDCKDKIVFIDRIAYKELLTYQSIADVIVCPDKDNLYSHYVIHVKYYDALLSGKLVINGSFKSVIEINPDESISLSFRPSDSADLFLKLNLCKSEYQSLMEKYTHVKSYVAKNLIYSSFVKRLYTLNK